MGASPKSFSAPSTDLPHTESSPKSLALFWERAAARSYARLEARKPLQARIWPEYRDNPSGFIVDVLGGLPWSAQRRVAKTIAENPLVAVAACNGPGKTWLLARLVLWWIYTRENAVCLTTANTWIQVANQLWRELRSAHATSRQPLGGEVLNTQLNLGPKHYATGISSNHPEQVAGFHGTAGLDWRRLLADDNPDGFEVSEDLLAEVEAVKQEGGAVLVLVDEASLLEEELYRAFLTLLTNPGSRIVLSGNPTRTQGPFFDVFHPPPGVAEWPWVTDRIRATEAPASIIRPEWIEMQRKLAGPNPERNPYYAVSVLAEFPTSSDAQLFSLTLLEAASVGASEGAPRGKFMGVDIARHGGDKCVAVLIVDGRVRAVAAWHVEAHHGNNLVLTANRIKALIEGWDVKPENCSLDCTGGWGWGPHDLLHEQRVPVSAVDFGAGPLGDWRWILGESPRLATRRQELHWIALRVLQERYLSIPHPRESPAYLPLWSDLTSIQYDFRRREDLWVESKDEYRKRMGRSPDYSDALLCALARGEGQRVRFAVV